MIRDPYVLESIEDSDTTKEIYKILLNFFRKPRKKSTSPIFEKKMINKLNLTVDKIKRLLMNEEIFEAFFPTFNEYVGESGEFTPMSIEGFTKEKKAIEKPKKVNLLVGNFQPFHLGHAKAAERLQSKNNHPIVIITSIKDTPTTNSPFSEKQIKTILNKIEQEYGSLIEDIIVLKGGSVEEILGSLKPKYIPILWGTQKNKLDGHVLKLNHLKKRNPALNLNKDFQLVELPKYQSSSEIRDIIKDENFSEFKRLVPKSVSSEFYNLKRELDRVNESLLIVEQTTPIKLGNDTVTVDNNGYLIVDQNDNQYKYKLANGDSTYKAQSFKDEGGSYNLQVIVQETFLGNVTKGIEVTKDKLKELLKQAGNAIVHIDKEAGSFLKLIQ